VTGYNVDQMPRSEYSPMAVGWSMKRLGWVNRFILINSQFHSNKAWESHSIS
jgi:hypothetical protein